MTVEVSDHAVLRYLERAWGVNVEAVRARVAREATASLRDPDGAFRPSRPCACAVLRGGLKFHFQGAGTGRVALTSVTSAQPGELSNRARRIRRRHGCRQSASSGC